MNLRLRHLIKKNQTVTVVLFLIALCMSPCSVHAQQATAENGGTEFADYYKKPSSDKDFVGLVSVKVNYNYEKLAQEITAGCNNDYEKLKAIYLWICSHIEYDTSYTIRTADECLKKQKGVCQGYCDLFYQLAKSIGIRVEIIEGKSKDETGFIYPNGHGWLFGYTRPNHGILMDPTWGAGSVNGDKFIRSENSLLWFNVKPEWMILSHFPDKKEYQLIEKTSNIKEFTSSMPFNSLWLEYGMDIAKITERAKQNMLYLPQIYTQGEGIIELSDIPLSVDLRIGVQYPFRIKMNADWEFAIMNGDVISKSDEWKSEGNGVYSIDFMPREKESLRISIFNKTKNVWHTIVKYNIKEPDAMAWQMVARYYPLSTPEMKAVKNLDAQQWSIAGVNEHKLAAIIKEQHISELPVIFPDKEQKLTISSIPMSKQMKVGESYTFSFYPKTGIKWAVVNESEWFNEWQVNDSGLHTQTVIPKIAGKLYLYVQETENESYWSCMEYDVQ